MMTLKKLNELCKKHNINEDVKLMSDSGWECCETEMDGVYYSKKGNLIIFTQGSEYERDYCYPHTYEHQILGINDFEPLYNYKIYKKEKKNDL